MATPSIQQLDPKGTATFPDLAAGHAAAAPVMVHGHRIGTTAHVVWLAKRLLLPEECTAVVESLERAHGATFVAQASVAAPALPARPYRDADRLLVHGDTDAFARELQSRLVHNDCFLDRLCARGVVPLAETTHEGGDVCGPWEPATGELNRCFRVSRYTAPSTGFAPHRDAPFNFGATVMSDHSLVLCLRSDTGCVADEAAGASTDAPGDAGAASSLALVPPNATVFWAPPEDTTGAGAAARHVGLTVAEEMADLTGWQRLVVHMDAGDALIFDQRLLHAAGPVLSGTRIVMRTDLVRTRQPVPSRGPGPVKSGQEATDQVKHKRGTGSGSGSGSWPKAVSRTEREQEVRASTRALRHATAVELFRAAELAELEGAAGAARAQECYERSLSLRQGFGLSGMPAPCVRAMQLAQAPDFVATTGADGTAGQAAGAKGGATAAATLVSQQRPPAAAGTHAFDVQWPGRDLHARLTCLERRTTRYLLAHTAGAHVNSAPIMRDVARVAALWAYITSCSRLQQGMVSDAVATLARACTGLWVTAAAAQADEDASDEEDLEECPAPPAAAAATAAANTGYSSMANALFDAAVLARIHGEAVDGVWDMEHVGGTVGGTGFGVSLDDAWPARRPRASKPRRGGAHPAKMRRAAAEDDDDGDDASDDGAVSYDDEDDDEDDDEGDDDVSAAAKARRVLNALHTHVPHVAQSVLPVQAAVFPLRVEVAVDMTCSSRDRGMCGMCCENMEDAADMCWYEERHRVTRMGPPTFVTDWAPVGGGCHTHVELTRAGAEEDAAGVQWTGVVRLRTPATAFNHASCQCEWGDWEKNEKRSATHHPAIVFTMGVAIGVDALAVSCFPHIIM